jgi:ABC-type ATPase involved in cell division
MGFYFMRIDEDRDKQILRAAIIAECRKPLRLQEETNGLPDSLSSGETQVIAHFGGFRKY